MYWDYYPAAAARPKAKPGKARKKFGTTWWGKKWVDVYQNMNVINECLEEEHMQERIWFLILRSRQERLLLQSKDRAEVILYQLIF